MLRGHVLLLAVVARCVDRIPSTAALNQRLARDRILTETYGPFVAVDRRPALPMAVATIEVFLTEL